MARCSYCGDGNVLELSAKPVCEQCDRENVHRTALAASDLTKARVQMRDALDEVTRLKDAYVAMPKPSSDGDLAIRLAQRIYERADAEVKCALDVYRAMLQR